MKSKSRIKHIVNQICFQTAIPHYKRSIEAKAGLDGNTLTHVTYYACGNAGDTVLSECVRQTFRLFDNNVGFHLFGVNEKVDSDTILKINLDMGVIIGGGGLFLPDTNENSISGWQWAISKEQLNAIKKPIIVFSVGYNYFPGQIPSSLFIDNLNELIYHSQFVGLRNNGSVEAIKKLIDPSLHEKVVYQPCTTTIIDNIFPSDNHSKRNGKRIAVNMAFDRIEKRLGNNYEAKLSSIARAIKAIEDRGYQIYYIAHCYEDLRFIPYLEEARVSYVAKDISTWFPNKIIDMYRSIDMVIGMRGHAQMIPFGAGCKILTLGSHDKMRWFLEDICCLDWYIDLIQSKSIEEDILKAFINIQEENSNRTDLRLRTEREKLWEITCDNMSTVTRILAK